MRKMYVIGALIGRDGWDNLSLSILHCRPNHLDCRLNGITDDPIKYVSSHMKVFKSPLLHILVSAAWDIDTLSFSMQSYLSKS